VSINEKTGPLTDRNLTTAERLSFSHLFAGAIGDGGWLAKLTLVTVPRALLRLSKHFASCAWLDGTALVLRQARLFGQGRLVRGALAPAARFFAFHRTHSLFQFLDPASSS
jgi:hypothetical protein